MRRRWRWPWHLRALVQTFADSRALDANFSRKFSYVGLESGVAGSGGGRVSWKRCGHRWLACERRALSGDKEHLRSLVARLQYELHLLQVRGQGQW